MKVSRPNAFRQIFCFFGWHLNLGEFTRDDQEAQRPYRELMSATCPDCGVLILRPITQDELEIEDAKRILKFPEAYSSDAIAWARSKLGRPM